MQQELNINGQKSICLDQQPCSISFLSSQDLFDQVLKQCDKDNQAITQCQSYIPKKGCKCKKSKCLKLYCQCFHSGQLCTLQCSCQGCKNTEDHLKQIYLAKKLANQRNPGYFKDISMQTFVKRCNCKKSHCLKKYCQCYNAGIKCGPWCHCQYCYNCVAAYPHKFVIQV